MKVVHIISFILVVVGAINWGLVGAAKWNLVDALLGSWPVVARIVYVLVGLAGLVLLFTHKKSCSDCASSSSAGSTM